MEIIQAIIVLSYM